MRAAPAAILDKHEKEVLERAEGIEPPASILEGLCSTYELERLLPWAWKAEQLVTAVDA
jgi:hypothetical protein